MNFSRAGGSGGQNVNRRATAVQMTHKETGLQVRCTEGRTQRKNRERALEIMEAKLQQKQREKEERKRAKKRQNQIGTGGRSEKIRTYNFPQDRITDHRTGENFSEIPAVLDGELDEIFAHLLTAFADAEE
jgi:peptide chain release factor 1